MKGFGCSFLSYTSNTPRNVLSKIQSSYRVNFFTVIRHKFWCKIVYYLSNVSDVGNQSAFISKRVGHTTNNILFVQKADKTQCCQPLFLSQCLLICLLPIIELVQANISWGSSILWQRHTMLRLYLCKLWETDIPKRGDTCLDKVCYFYKSETS